jgi:Tfp pilus assembly protein PilF
VERIEKIKQFLKNTPKDSFLQHALALEYIKSGQDDKAKTLFENILSQDPAYIGSYYHMAKLLERINNIPAAINYYEKGMEAAKKAGDMHALNELKAAKEGLEE